MKIWYHVIAAVVGMSVAALIVWVVFGTASEQGATQDGAAPGALATEAAALCGTVKPASTSTSKARRQALANPPALFDPKGPIAGIRDDKPDQKQWLARVHAATGMCADEIRFPETGVVEISMSTVDDVSEADAAAYAGMAMEQAFTPPFNPRKVTVVTTIGDTDRVASATTRGWNVYQAQRRQLGLPVTMKTLSQFRRATSLSKDDLNVVGWR